MLIDWINRQETAPQQKKGEGKPESHHSSSPSAQVRTIFNYKASHIQRERHEQHAVKAE